uniref:18S rRNA (pseudouridine-N1)-methyltransferase n=1 Tax=Clastoptera arizonana TaxID=38151 RepID=A0A1B6CP32_9HEMI
MGNKRRKLEGNNTTNEFDPAPRHLSIAHIKNQEKRLIVILENAQLESVKVGNAFELLNCDDHVGILKKNERQPGSCRPDIVHQCLLMLLDSPLNRAGLLQVYVHTEKNVLIEINPQTRIPRTFKRFAGLMIQLLHKFNVRASEGSMKLLKVIKNPIADHLPVGCRKISTSFSAKKVINPKDIVPLEDPIAIVIGAMAHGQVSVDYTEDCISISNYPLSAALACTKLCSAFEEVWGIV